MIINSQQHDDCLSFIPITTDKLPDVEHFYTVVDLREEEGGVNGVSILIFL